jgi:hypothetical protein
MKFVFYTDLYWISDRLQCAWESRRYQYQYQLVSMDMDQLHASSKDSSFDWKILSNLTLFRMMNSFYHFKQFLTLIY